ncbi:AIR synthase related protein [Marinicrinis sediminis]|uniref:Phosphoribosylformylglycinamidine cyclo-ligase n=1 Tax=Marinicrinis sediminis TaxID=1652465 RepID=A0ABW5RD13_9BACL
MGAKREAVLDIILCGQIEKEVVLEIVESISQACKEQNCTLIGGETSEQPKVLNAGTYMLNASMLGVVDKNKRSPYKWIDANSKKNRRRADDFK